MDVHLNQITGLSDAIISMFMSKRNWSPELNDQIINVCTRVFDSRGFYRDDYSDEDFAKVQDWLEKLFRWGKKHITLLRYLDFSCTVEGLHRGAQDDFDSHAKRLENRIVRSSTRLAKFGNEKSDFYKGKILTTDEAAEMLDIKLPNSIVHEGTTYLKTINGYVAEEYADNKDVLRGLYMLSIPSNFVYKCNITEFAHIVKERDHKSNAAPELRDMIELTISKLNKIFPQLTHEYYYSICN